MIENDLFRTTHSTDESDQRALRRVLQAYVLFCPQVGYCQGMSYLAHLIIERMQDEPMSFWMFVTLMERYGLKAYFLPDLRRLKVVCYQLDVLTKRFLPQLHAHLEDLMVPTHSYAATWVQTVFADMRTLPKSFVEKIWDNFLLNTHSPAVVVMQVMLAILKLASSALLAAGIDDVLVILQTLPRERVGEFSAEDLLACAWRFPITKETLSGIEARYLKHKKRRNSL